MYALIGVGTATGTGFEGFGTAAEPIAHWSTRAATAKQAVAAAIALGHPVATPMLYSALPLVLEANAIVNQQRQGGTWTEAAEQGVADLLAKARAFFDSAQGLALSSAPQQRFPYAFPTWALAAKTIPGTAPGAVSPGELPPPAPPAGGAPAPANGAPGTQPGMIPGLRPLGIPTWVWVTGVVGLVGVAAFAFFGRR